MSENISWKIILEYLMIGVGAVLMAFSVNLFLAAFGIAPGGVTGFSVVMYSIKGWPIYLTNLAINIPLFIFGLRVLGKDTAIKTIFSTIVYTIALKYILIIKFTDDVLLATIFGGILTGVGLGLVFKFGGTTGGSDLAGAILNKFFPRFKFSSFMMAIDMVIVILAGLADKRPEITLYSIVTVYMTVRVTNAILEGPGYSSGFYIISNKPEEISKDIMEKLGRGVTALHGMGMYTKTEKEVLFVVVSRAQFSRVKEIALEHDPKALVTVTEMREVLGEGFSSNYND